MKNIHKNSTMKTSIDIRRIIRTDITAELKVEVKETYEKKFPLRKFDKNKEVAEPMAFLLSDQLSYITSNISKVNGGLYI